MPDLSPATTLTAAAQALRDAANATRHEMKTGTYWQGLDPDTAWERGISNAVGAHAGGFCALMSPDVALALADWLEHFAEFLRGVEQTHGTVTELALYNSRHALTVARALLGEVTE